MRDNGRTTKWKGEEFSHGLMEEDMRVNILMIRKRVMVFSSGQTAESTKDSGQMVNNMESEHTLPHQAKLKKENGLKAKESIGFEILTILSCAFMIYLTFSIRKV
jgi:hypothetical protein